MCTQVAMTMASISPYLQVELEYTPSPGPLVTGRDSPVSADCEQLKSWDPKKSKTVEPQFNINPKNLHREEQLQFALPDRFSVDPLQADERQLE